MKLLRSLNRCPLTLSRLSLHLPSPGSVSLEDLDPAEMALVLGGAIGVRRVRDSRRVREGSLSSLTEEEAGPEHRSVLEVRSLIGALGCQSSPVKVF